MTARKIFPDPECCFEWLPDGDARYVWLLGLSLWITSPHRQCVPTSCDANRVAGFACLATFQTPYMCSSAHAGGDPSRRCFAPELSDTLLPASGAHPSAERVE